jgi:hypothetical protein
MSPAVRLAAYGVDRCRPEGARRPVAVTRRTPAGPTRATSHYPRHATSCACALTTTTPPTGSRPAGAAPQDPRPPRASLTTNLGVRSSNLFGRASKISDLQKIRSANLPRKVVWAEHGQIRKPVQRPCGRPVVRARTRQNAWAGANRRRQMVYGPGEGAPEHCRREFWTGPRKGDKPRSQGWNRAHAGTRGAVLRISAHQFPSEAGLPLAAHGPTEMAVFRVTVMPATGPCTDMGRETGSCVFTTVSNNRRVLQWHRCGLPERAHDCAAVTPRICQQRIGGQSRQAGERGKPC